MRCRNALALLLLLVAAPASAQVPARCLVNTNPPVYGDNTYQFLSCQTDGKLRTTTSAGGAGGGTFSTFGAAFPADGTAGGFSDGTNMQGARVFDLDTGGGTQYILGVNLRASSGGGSVELGTLTNPLRIDPTGTTTQPISAASLPLPTNAATDRATAAGPVSTRLSDGAAFYDATKTGQLPAALVGGRLDANTGAWLGSTAPTVGQKAMASSLPVVIASDQSAIPASQSGTWNITNVSGTVSLPTGAATDRTTAGGPSSVRLSDGAAFYDATKTGQLPAALVGGRLDENVGAWLGSTAPTVGSKTSANSVPVVIASDQGAVAVSGTVTTTPPSNASTNVAQFGGTNVSTGTGAGGAGIPRVTISSDSSLAANQSTNVAQFGGTNVVTGTGASAAGVPRVTVSNDSTVTANAGTNLNTSALFLDATFTGRINTQGQKTMAASTPVVLASDQAAIPVTGGGVSATDSAAWTAAASAFAPIGGEYNPSAAALASGQQGTVAMTANRALLANAVDSTGRELGAALPGKQTVPLLVSLAPSFPAPPTLGKNGPSIVSVPWGQAVGTPVRQVVPEGMLSSNGVRPAIFCDKSVAIDTAASGSTQLVALAAGQAIYICGLDWISTSALSVKFVYGTGTNCATGATNFEGAQAVAANGGKVIAVSNAPKWTAPAGQALCINLSGATQVSGSVTYAQF